jgi:hypothetical protein
MRSTGVVECVLPRAVEGRSSWRVASQDNVVICTEGFAPHACVHYQNRGAVKVKLPLTLHPEQQTLQFLNGGDDRIPAKAKAVEEEKREAVRCLRRQQAAPKLLRHARIRAVQRVVCFEASDAEPDLCLVFALDQFPLILLLARAGLVGLGAHFYVDGARRLVVLGQII